MKPKMRTRTQFEFDPSRSIMHQCSVNRVPSDSKCQDSEDERYDHNRRIETGEASIQS